MPQAIHDPLRNPPLNVERLGQVTGMKRLWQVGRQKLQQVRRRLKRVDAGDSHQPLVFHDVIIFPPAPPPAMPRIAPLLDLDQRRLERQPRMRKDPREIHQLLKHIEECRLLGTESSRNFLAAFPC